MTTVRYWLGVLLVVSLPPAVIWWFIIHPFVGFWRRVGVAPTLTIMTVLLALGMLGLYQVRDPLLGRDLGTSWALFATGIVLLVGAMWIGVKRKRELTLRILVGVPELRQSADDEVLTTGLYARIRHPRYVEVALGTVGYALLANHLGAYLVAAATLPALHLIVVLEERELLERFGEKYAAYAERVPRYLPRPGNAPP